MDHRSAEELTAGLDHVRAAPAGAGTVSLVVRRPAVDEREVLDAGRLTPEDGLEGDAWRWRGSRRTEDGSALVDAQLNVMGARAAALVAGDDPARWALAGDQLYLDLDLSTAGLPPGSRLRVGDAVIEVTAEPHTGCAKFSRRFGVDALRLVNSEEGRALNLRGVCARVVRAGTVRPGDEVRRLAPADDDG